MRTTSNRRIFAPVLSISLILAGLAGCSSEPSAPAEAACKGILAGDVVITELMTDPDGVDTGNEYVELYNANGKELDLKGLTLFAAKLDGSKEKTHTMGDAKIQPANYFVVGDSTAKPLPAYLNYSYGADLGNLGNDSGMVGLRCGKTLIDKVTWTTAGKSGVARILDGKLVPDSAANDEEKNFCEATTQDANGIWGSPGAPNEECPSSAPEGSCLLPDGTYRPIVTPVPGDLVITEVMPNPEAVSDTVGEWFEVLALTPVDLNGLTLTNGGTGKTVISKAECMRAEVGQYLLFARKTEPEINGGLTNVTAAFSLTLGNSAGALVINSGDVIIDKVTWTSSKAGVSIQLDPSKLNATSNDDPTSFCDGTDPYGTAGTDKGTPGAANEVCPVPPDPNNCDDNGSSRPIDPPAAGDLVVTELMSDPTKVGDDQGEWIELFVKRDLDLNGVTIKNEGTGSMLLGGSSCLHVTANSYLVFVRNPTSDQNGGIASPYGELGFSLPNSGANRAIIVERDGSLIDRIDYSADELVWAGASTQLDANKLDATQNDQASSFCKATAAYGAGDLGTPGAPNAACSGGVDPNACDDNGTSRQIDPPAAGDLVITEFMSQPTKVTEDQGQWIEIFVKRDLDLNGVTIGDEGTGTMQLTGTSCLHVTANSHLVFVRNPTCDQNGGVADPYGQLGFALSDSGAGHALIVQRNGTLIDRIDYDAGQQVWAGASTQLDSGKYDATQNDLAASFCEATAAYGAGDLGTPGAQNGTCP